MNRRVLFLFVIGFIGLLIGNVALGQDTILSQVKTKLPAGYKDTHPILIPQQGFGKFNKEELIDNLLKQQMFQGDFQNEFNLKSTLDDFRENRVVFYDRYTAHELEIKKQPELSAKNIKLRALYFLLWAYQDKDKHIYLYKHLANMDVIEQTKRILSLNLLFKNGYFDGRIYPYLEKMASTFSDKDSPYFDKGLLSATLEASSSSLSEQQTHALADLAVKNISELPIKDKKTYNDYLLLLSRYAGKKSMPYFKTYFEDEYQSFYLIAVIDYFKKYLDKIELESMMRRKVHLLKQAQEKLDKHIIDLKK